MTSKHFWLFQCIWLQTKVTYLWCITLYIDNYTGKNFSAKFIKSSGFFLADFPKTHTVGDTGTVDTAADLFAMQNYFVEEGHFQDYFTLGRIDKYV